MPTLLYGSKVLLLTPNLYTYGTCGSNIIHNVQFKVQESSTYTATDVHDNAQTLILRDTIRFYSSIIKPLSPKKSKSYIYISGK